MPEKPPSNQVMPASPWAPLGHPTFRALWIATVVSSIGSWMHEVGAGWLMVTLNPSPMMVSLVQAAMILPIFFLALPAGALADVVDRRRYLIAAQSWMLGCAALLAVTTFPGWTQDWTLLLLTFALGCGNAMLMPAWSATLPQLVPREELPAAVALNSMGINLARAVGPALAGILVAVAGPAPTFLLNAISFTGVIYVLLRWRRAPQPRTMYAERFIGALRAGVRYVREAPQLQAVTARTAVLFLFCSGIWALLPLVARDSGGGAGAYGTLLACVGAGAVGGAFVLPHLRNRLSRDGLLRAATVGCAGAMFAVSLGRSLAVLVPAMLLLGASWISALSTLHVSAQTSVPTWVRARALSVYLMVFSASMTGGSVLWGATAERWGVPVALMIAAAGAIAALFATGRFSLGQQHAADPMAPVAWPVPETHGAIEPDRGPVLVTVEYRVAPENAAAFVEEAQALRSIRRRDGAVAWGLFEDAARPGCYVESFLVESWAEHVRQHERGTAADRDVNERIRKYHVGPEPPQVRHLIAPGPGEG
jgi:MFS family permease